MNKDIFKNTKYFIIDMDGTFYLDGNIIDGSADFIEKVRESGRDFYFFTNNSSNNVEVCRAKLEKMGFPVDEKRVIISSHVAAAYLNKNYPGKRVFLLGNERLTGDFAASGINLVSESPDIVVLGFDTTLTYQKIWDAVRYIDGGAIYLATHPDLNCPTADGYMPDTGSMIEMFAASTGKRPLVLGKPMTATVDCSAVKEASLPLSATALQPTLQSELTTVFPVHSFSAELQPPRNTKNRISKQAFALKILKRLLSISDPLLIGRKAVSIKRKCQFATFLTGACSVPIKTKGAAWQQKEHEK